ncbi:MAG TPA: AMP-binding protein [Acidimicrobiales bacterium]
MTQPPGVEGQTLPSLVDRRAAATPRHVLLVDESGRRMTADGFRASSQRVADRLRATGIDRGSLVSWILPTRMEALVLTLALSRLGAVQIPVIPVYREREIGHILDETALDAFIVTPRWRGFDYLELCQDLTSSRGGRTAVLTVDDVVDGSAEPVLRRVPQGAGRDLGETQWIFYTSGTGGLPKGVRHRDAALAAAAHGMVEHLAMTSEDRSGVAFPIAHIGGPINVMAGLLAGSTLILVENFEPQRTSDVLAREGVTMAGSGTAFHLAYLEVQAQRPDRPLFPDLRCCPGGGAPKPLGLHERVKRELGGAGIVSGWGLTEAPVLSMGRPGDRDEQLSETEGSPLPGVRLRTVSSDGRACQAGEQGELRARAPQMMLGYVDPSLTADAFDDEGWLGTGDLGTIDEEGYVRITGRLKDVVIRNGENIGTAEVEELLRGHPHVADAAVFGLPDSRTGERVCAVVELVPAAPHLDLGGVGAFLGSRGLRRQAWPEQLETLAALPRTVAGKIDTRQLRERFGAARAGSA